MTVLTFLVLQVPCHLPCSPSLPPEKPQQEIHCIYTGKVLLCWDSPSLLEYIPCPLLCNNFQL